MADVMEGAARLHWFQFRVIRNGELVGRADVPVWRKDSENTDDYLDAHPAMLERAMGRLSERYGDEHGFEAISGH